MLNYILAVLLPPLAVAMTGKTGQTLINIVLTIIGWFPGAIHAAYMVHKSRKEATV
ncbi:YqaE/Pmp3 family membrane protein [Pseudalkalibacillus caeni]|uniref:YqaE/Pmp3 family membrane protein n=1 Tax=Exobacillus caeni TaxID=2574798 RepID=A0A5R9F965_9BACL|nr:YqaE/Pmp3 family membrane protein [Pseudalkalibacillus caeni]TLS38856.1 YqaE/Pmp3 family membrane protein [Pseudalkalibacillus caeni]